MNCRARACLMHYLEPEWKAKKVRNWHSSYRTREKKELETMHNTVNSLNLQLHLANAQSS